MHSFYTQIRWIFHKRTIQLKEFQICKEINVYSHPKSSKTVLKLYKTENLLRFYLNTVAKCASYLVQIHSFNDHSCSTYKFERDFEIMFDLYLLNGIAKSRKEVGKWAWKSESKAHDSSLIGNDLFLKFNSTPKSFKLWVYCVWYYLWFIIQKLS